MIYTGIANIITPTNMDRQVKNFPQNVIGTTSLICFYLLNIFIIDLKKNNHKLLYHNQQLLLL